MTHDPLCPMDWDPTPFDCGHCLLIARVREDEKKRILQAAYESAPSQVRQDEVARIYNLGYSNALKDAMKVVESE